MADARPCPPASRAGRRTAGFTLFEALVALLVAAFALPALAHAMAEAWASTRAPMERVSAVALAGDAAAGSDGAIADARRRGFAVERLSGPVKILVRPSRIAPAPADGTPANPPSGSAVPGGMKLDIPKTLGSKAPGGGGGARPRLQHVTVTVRAPSGRRFVLDTVGLVDAAP